MLRYITLILAGVALISCTGAGAIPEASEPSIAVNPDKQDMNMTAYTPVRFNLSSREAEPSPDDRKKCEEVGGRVQRAGLLGAYHCIQEYPDGGKACSDSEDCLGWCRADNSDNMGQPGTGTCQKTDVAFGCHALVEKGVIGPMLCVD